MYTLTEEVILKFVKSDSQCCVVYREGLTPNHASNEGRQPSVVVIL